VASEARREAVRIATNYLRLGTTVVLGLALVPILLIGIGPEGYGIYGLMGSTVGIAQMFREISRYSMNRELGAAWHSRDPGRFAAIYNSAFVLSIGMAALAAAVFAVLLLIVPVLNIPDHLHGAARWMIVGAGVNTFIVVALQAMQNMYMVTGRFVGYNIRNVLERAGYTAAAVALFVFPWQVRDTGLGLTLFALIGNGISSLIFIIAVVGIVASEPSLRPDFSKVTRSAVRSVAGTGGWNIATAVAMSLHIRVDQIIVNLFFGITGNAAFTLAVTLTSYVRMLTVGITDGLDAVSARITAGDHTEDAVRHLVHHTTRMTAFVALPAGLAVSILAGPLLELWTARRVANAAAIIPYAALTVQILMVGMTSRAITDNWTRILYGAGYVSHYARQVLFGGILNPIVAIVLVMYVLPGPLELPEGLPGPYKFYGPAIAFAAVFTAVHLLFLPVIGARCLNIRYRDLFWPILPSAAIAILCSPILVGAHSLIGRWNIPLVVLVVGLYGAIYFAIGLFVVVTRAERQRIVKFAMRAIGRSKRPPPGPPRPPPPVPAPEVPDADE
jgi:O-antigen/teichoic acid export membrane protein